MEEFDEFALALIDQLSVEINEEKEITSALTKATQDAAFKVKFEEIKALFDLNNPSVLEIAATFEYFQADARLNEFEALIRLKDLKPFYSETELAIGVSKAKQLFFKPSETDLSELKKELMPWQEASLRDLSVRAL